MHHQLAHQSNVFSIVVLDVSPLHFIQLDIVIIDYLGSIALIRDLHCHNSNYWIRQSAVLVCILTYLLCVVSGTASFGTASLSMPAGFGTSASYSLPTSFSGTFHQPAFPPQTAFPQQTAFSQQPNGNIQGTE